MNSFSLIKQLQPHLKAPDDGPGIEYQHYDLDGKNQTFSVLIPIRECANFENSVNEMDRVTPRTIRDLLRKHRGLNANNK